MKKIQINFSIFELQLYMNLYRLFITSQFLNLENLLLKKV